MRVTRLFLVPLGLFGLASATQCGSSPAGHQPVEGGYHSTTPGSIKSVTFVDATHYWMVAKSPCPAGQADCAQRGTYVVSKAYNTIAFADESNGKVTTLPFTETSTGPSVLSEPLHVLGLPPSDEAGVDDASTSGDDPLFSGDGALYTDTPVALTFDLDGQSFAQGGATWSSPGPLTIGNVTARTVSAASDVPLGPPAAGAYRVHNIDLGTGLGILVQGHDFTMLFDGGSNDDARQMSAKANGDRLLAYLAAALGPSGPLTCTPDGDGRTRVAHPMIHIDHIFLSHPHNDHVSMLADVVRCYSVGNVWDSGDPYPSVAYAGFLNALGPAGVSAYHTASSIPASRTVVVSKKNIKIPSSVTWTEFAENDKVDLGAGAFLKVLHADGGSYPNDANLNSTVVRVDLGSTSLLLTGDEESGTSRQPPNTSPAGTELHLLTNHAADIKVDIFQVAHHGSMTSSRVEFLTAVQPVWALIGSGPFPYSGVVLPDASVIQALQALGPNILNTDAHDSSGCPTKDRVGLDDTAPGGCDNYVLDIAAQ